MSTVSIIEFTPLHQPDFERLNKHWIEKYFWMEPIDHEVLSKPEEHILSSGVYEFTKMAVDEKFQGLKIGKRLAEVAIAKAKEKKASKIILYSNTKLATAISLYRKLGFNELPLDGPYKRSDIKMELVLS